MGYVKAINAENLRIARENIGLDTKVATGHISSAQEDLVLQFEKGETLPTWSQVTKLSKLYNVPELLFFSKELIKKNKTIPDYRVGANNEGDFGVKKLVNLVVTRQKWLEGLLKEEGFSKNTLQGSGKSIQSPEALARFISDKLGIDISKIKAITGTKSRKKVLEYLVQKAENKGIFVGKTISYHRLSVDDMRGLFVSNDYCPFIVINRKDALSGQIFSLVHEFAHLFRKSDAISNSLEFRSTNSGIDPEEVFCNKVAAELLLPKNELTKNFYDKADIDQLSELYKVSKIFIFYRLKDLKKIKSADADSLEREIKAETERNIKLKEAQEKEKEGGDYTNSMRDSNGSLFNRVISKSYSDNKIGYVEASNLLRFSAEKI